MPFFESESVCTANMQGIKDIRCRDASNMCDDECHEECVEVVERSFMPKSKPLGMESYSLSSLHKL